MSRHLHPLPCWANGGDDEAGTQVLEREPSGQLSDRSDPPITESVHVDSAVPSPDRTRSLPAVASDLPADDELGPTPLQSYGAWATSLAMHVLLLFVLSLIALSLGPASPEPQIVSIFTPLEDSPLAEIIPVEDTWNTDSDVPIVATVAKAVVEKSVRQLDGATLSPSDFGLPELPEQVMAITPDVDIDDVDEIVHGIQGDVVTTDGDVGSVDRITTEILMALRESRVLVVWLLDASESLTARREQVIGRFDRVYQELGEMSEDEPDALLTSIVGFGQKATLMTQKPTSDPDQLRKAVRSIPVDNTGVENVFAAVATAAQEYRDHARKGYRVMLVVLTDESGNDFEAVDKATALVTEHNMPVYVLGPLAPFSRQEIRIRWVDPETSDVFHLPVERGPAAAVAEYPVSLFTLFGKNRIPVLSSGFGPYGLARLAHESGGITFVYNDGHIKGPSFDSMILSEYAPEYITESEYRQRVERNPIRNSFLTCSLAIQEADFPQPETEFLAAGIQFQIRKSFQSMEASYDALGQVVEELMSVRTSYAKEASKRWRAHYDLLLGQALVRRIQIENSVPLLNTMYETPQACKDVVCNAFALSGIRESALLDGNPENGAVASDSEGGDAEMSETELARLHLQRVVQDHAGTPWAVMAKAELEAPLDVEWRETFVEPPEGEPMPWDKAPGEWKALSKEEQEKLEAAREKFERFRRFRAEQQKKKEEQARESGTESGGRKRQPPKL